MSLDDLQREQLQRALERYKAKNSWFSRDWFGSGIVDAVKNWRRGSAAHDKDIARGALMDERNEIRKKYHTNADYAEDGKSLDFRRSLGEVLSRRSNDPKVRNDPNRIAKSARFGPIPDGKAYGDFLKTQANMMPQDEAEAPKEETVNEVKKAAGGIPELLFKAIKAPKLYSDEDLAKFDQFTPVDASDQDAEFAAMKKRGSDRDAARNQEIDNQASMPMHVDLSPVMALWKSWYGGDYDYKRPESGDERLNRIYAMRNQLREDQESRDQKLFNIGVALSDRKIAAQKYNEETPKANLKTKLGLQQDQAALDWDALKTNTKNQLDVQDSNRQYNLNVLRAIRERGRGSERRDDTLAAKQLKSAVAPFASYIGGDPKRAMEVNTLLAEAIAEGKASADPNVSEARIIQNAVRVVSKQLKVDTK